MKSIFRLQVTEIRHDDTDSKGWRYLPDSDLSSPAVVTCQTRLDGMTWPGALATRLPPPLLRVGGIGAAVTNVSRSSANLGSAASQLHPLPERRARNTPGAAAAAVRPAGGQLGARPSGSLRSCAAWGHVDLAAPAVPAASSAAASVSVVPLSRVPVSVDGLVAVRAPLARLADQRLTPRQ